MAANCKHKYNVIVSPEPAAIRLLHIRHLHFDFILRSTFSSTSKMAHHLDSRFLGGLFKSSDSSTTCARPEINDIGDVLPIGITVQELLFYATLVCLGLTTISSFMLILRHAGHYTKPKEQKQQIRIRLLAFVHATHGSQAVKWPEMKEH